MSELSEVLNEGRGELDTVIACLREQVRNKTYRGAQAALVVNNHGMDQYRVGDWVVVAPDANGKTCVIEHAMTANHLKRDVGLLTTWITMLGFPMNGVRIEPAIARLIAAEAERERLREALEKNARLASEKRRGVAIIVQCGSKVLTCLRINCRDMNGRWQFGGGAVEREETAMEAAYRELHEETGMLTRSMEYLCDTSGFTPEGEPMWTSFFVADCAGYEPVNSEPDKHGPWEWVEIEELLSRPIIGVMRPALAALAARAALQAKSAD